MVQAFKNITGQTREMYVPIIHFNKNPIKLKSNRNYLLLIYSKTVPYNISVKFTDISSQRQGCTVLQEASNR